MASCALLSFLNRARLLLRRHRATIALLRAIRRRVRLALLVEGLALRHARGRGALLGRARHRDAHDERAAAQVGQQIGASRRARRLADFAEGLLAPEYSSSNAEFCAGENSSPEGLPCLRTVARAFVRRAASTSAAEHFARSLGAIAGTSLKQPALMAMLNGVMTVWRVIIRNTNMRADNPIISHAPPDSTHTASAKKKEDA